MTQREQNRNRYDVIITPCGDGQGTIEARPSRLLRTDRTTVPQAAVVTITSVCLLADIVLMRLERMQCYCGHGREIQFAYNRDMALPTVHGALVFAGTSA